MIQKEQRMLQKDFNTNLDQYNTALAEFSDMKSDIELQVADMKYENEIARQKYQIDLQQYNTDRSRMDSFAMAKFEAQSKELATQKAQDFQREMTKIDQEFQKNNQKPQYMTDMN